MSINFQLDAPQIAQDMEDMVHERLVFGINRALGRNFFKGQEHFVEKWQSKEAVFLSRWCGLLVHMRDCAGLRLDIHTAMKMLSWHRLVNLCGQPGQVGSLGSAEPAKLLRDHLLDPMDYFWLCIRINRALSSYADIPDVGHVLRR